VANKIKKNPAGSKITATDKSHLVSINQVSPKLSPEQQPAQQPAQPDSTLEALSTKNNPSVNKYEMFDNMGIGGELL